MPLASISRRSRALMTGASLLALIGLALAGCAQSTGGANATATTAPSATAQPTTCAQVQGFASAAALSLPAMEFPAGTVAQNPAISAGGAGQYTVKTYQACAPNTDTNLTVSTGKGPEPFTKLVLFYGWAQWSQFPTGGDAQMACPGVCFAFNASDASKGLFMGAPGFLSLENVTSLGHGLVTFTLRMTAPPAAPGCYFPQPGGAPEIAIWYDQSAGIQYPPLTYASGDATMSTDGFALCSPGTVGSVKAFMDHQFLAAGYASDPCQAYDCWKKSSLVVSMQFTSAKQWFIFTPRVQPTP